MKSRKIFKVFGLLLFAALFILFLGYTVMYLWNHIVSPVFGISMLTFAQAVGLLVLVRILTGNIFRSWSGGWWHHKGEESEWKTKWKSRWEEKFAKMSDDEKEKAKKMFWKKCNYYEFYEPKKEEQTVN